MSVGVYTLDTRYTLVQKTAGEVGDGTAWAMLVTLDQLDEITLRVKDAWFTSGAVTTTPGETPSAGIGMSMEGGDPPSAYISVDISENYFIRGYCWWNIGEDLNADDIPYFGDSYNVTIPAFDGGIPDYLAEFFPPTYPPESDIQRDIGTNERALNLPENSATPTAKINALTLRTAFSQEMFCGGAGTGYLIDHPAPSQLRLEIYPEVAWVDENESGNPYDPANKLYLKMRFGVLCTASPFDIVALDTMPDSGFHSFVEATDLVFQLAGSTCSAKVYFYEDYDGAGAATFSSASPFIVTAKEWWPYAKPGGPVWNSGTGAKL